MTGGGVAVAGHVPVVMTTAGPRRRLPAAPRPSPSHDADPSQKTATFTVTPDVSDRLERHDADRSERGRRPVLDPTAKTLWFRPTGAGSFTLNATVTDQVSPSGARSPSPTSPASTGWAGSTGGADTSSPVLRRRRPTRWTAGAGCARRQDGDATNGTRHDRDRHRHDQRRLDRARPARRSRSAAAPGSRARPSR